MKLIKSVRLGYTKTTDNLFEGKIVKNEIYFNNYKLSIFNDGKNKRVINVSRVDFATNKEDIQGIPLNAVFYEKRDKDKTNDELINDYILTVNKNNSDVYIEIIQDEWVDGPPPIEREFGGPSNWFYLNNGSIINILWFSSEKSGLLGTDPSIQSNFGTVSYPYNLFGEEISEPFQNLMGKRWSDELGNEKTIPNGVPNEVIYTDNNPISNLGTFSIPYGSKNFDLETGLDIIASDQLSIPYYAAKAKEIKDHVIEKIMIIFEPVDKGDAQSIYLLDDNTFKKSSEIESFNEKNNYPVGAKIWPGGVDDFKIVKDVIQYWKKNVPNYELDICSPSNEFCRIIPYKDPFNDDPQLEDRPTPATDNTGTQSRVNLSVVLPEDLDAIVRTDIETIKVYIGEPFDPFAEAFNFTDDGYGSDADLLQGELESAFAGVEDGGEKLFSDEEYTKESVLAEKNESVPISPESSTGNASGIVSTGDYTSELPKETSKNGFGTYKSGPFYGYNNVPYYGQYDSRWGNVIYGLSEPLNGSRVFIEKKIDKVKKDIVSVEWKGSTYKIKCAHSSGVGGFSSIQGGGCGITSFTMVINFWMIKLNKGIYTSPIKMAKMACENGARAEKPDPNGTQPHRGTFYSKINEVFGLKASGSSKGEVEKLVKQGYPCVVCGKGWTGYKPDGTTKIQGGGHFIVLTGYDPSLKAWRVNDPGASKNATYYMKSLNGLTAFYKILPPDLA